LVRSAAMDEAPGPVSAIRIRTAAPADAEAILALERELAEFERLDGPSPAEGARLVAWIFEERRFHALVAERDGEVCGVALYFFYPTSFRARPGMYLEDLVVSSSGRSTGIGRALMTELARMRSAKIAFGSTGPSSTGTKGRSRSIAGSAPASTWTGCATVWRRRRSRRSPGAAPRSDASRSESGRASAPGKRGRSRRGNGDHGAAARRGRRGRRRLVAEDPAAVRSRVDLRRRRRIERQREHR